MSEDKLYHHGIKGQRWGVRRYQNKDGSLTPLGEKRAAKPNSRKLAEELKNKRQARKLSAQKAKQDMKEDALDREANRKNEAKKTSAEVKAMKAKAKSAQNTADEDMYDLPGDSEAERARRAETGKKILIGAIAVVGTVAAGYAISRFVKNKKAAKDAQTATEDAIKKVSEEAAKKAALKQAKSEKKSAKQHNEFINRTIKQKKKLQMLKDGERELEKARLAKIISKGQKARIKDAKLDKIKAAKASKELANGILANLRLRQK